MLDIKIDVMISTVRSLNTPGPMMSNLGEVWPWLDFLLYIVPGFFLFIKPTEGDTARMSQRGVVHQITGHVMC